MNPLHCFVGTLIIATACAQDAGKTLIEASKVAKITIVDAINRANKALDGQVVAAMLDPKPKARPAPAYTVLIVHEGALWAIDVDAQGGTVGKPRAAVDDDDDDDNEKGEQRKEHAMAVKGEQTAAGKEQTILGARLDFEDTAVGALPQGWRAAETAGSGKLGTWRVEERADAPSGKRVLTLATTQNSGTTFNMVLSDARFPADLALSVRIHANNGSEDQGGGLVWRAKDAGNYYLARWNPLEDNLRCYKVVDERRSMFKSVELKADPKDWHHLAITMQGGKCTIAFDGKDLLEFEDDTFTQPGRVGVWTKADAASSFDVLEARQK
jgi:hypothetical protein